MPYRLRARPRSPRSIWLAPALLIAALAAPLAAFAEPLSLPAALARAAAQDPSRAATGERVIAAEAAARQAGLRPNPSIGVELENFAGTGPYSLLDGAEATVTYEQRLERGGKQIARVDRARAQTAVVQRRGEVRRLDYLRDVQRAYAEAMAAEAALMVAEARYVAAAESQAEVAKRVKSARDPLFAAARAETLTAQAEIGRDQAREAAKAARLALAAYWGGGDDFTLALEPYFQVAAPAPQDLNPDHPDLALLAAERDAALADLQLERAQQITDPTVRAGLRYLGERSDVAVVIGGSIPLQRYDRNQGNVERAQAARNAAEADLAAARRALEREIAALTPRVAASARESERIRAEVIPAALETVDLVRQGFSRGGFDYSDVTDAERALAEARARRVDVLRQYHLDLAALDRLTGRHAALATSAAEPRP